MRRVLAAFLVLFALAAGLIAGAWTAVLPQGDRAAFTGRTLAGDPAAAEGLTLSPVRVCSDYLVWEGAFPAAAPEQAGLSWNFYWCQYTEGHIAPRWLPLSIELDGGYAEPDRTHNNPLAQAVLDALSRGDTSAYRTDTDNFLTLRMADYADTLPFEVDADTFTIGESRVVSSASEVTDLFRAYFSIPTPDGLQMEITLHAAQDGTIPFLSFEPDDALTLSSPSLSNGSGLYFTLCAQGELAWELDPSQIPGCWGLYRFDGTDIETVWSLPEGERPANFWSDGEDFFFLSRDREGAYLYLLDPEAFTPERRLALFPLDAAAPDPAFYLDGEAGFLAVAVPGSLALLTRENGAWDLAFTADTSAQEEAGCPLYGYMDMADEWAGYLDWAFDGERLAVTGAWEDGDCYAAVYDAGGLAWLGGYSSTFQDTYCDDDLPHVGSRFTRLGPANQSLCCPVSWRE